MHFRFTGLCLAIGLLGCQSTAASSASGAAVMNPHAASPGRGVADAQEVVATVERLFSNMRTRDTAALREQLDTTLLLVVHGTATDGSPRMSQRTVPQFLRSIAASTEELRERMWHPEVRVDGALATLWAPYDFHIGERFSHCGHDAVHLARRNGRWIVTALAYTIQQTGCTPAPIGK